jgi:predicted lactoylglutathione lyase
VDQRVTFITLGVSDVARSRRFYEGGLGWSSNYTDERIAFYQSFEVAIGLFLIDELAANLDLRTEQVRTGAVMLTRNVASRQQVDDILARALAAGATLLKAPQDLPWGEYAGYFADPDGHPWEVAHNPDLAFDEHGRVTLPSGR